MVSFHNRTYGDFNQKWSLYTIFCVIFSLYFWIFVFNYDQWSRIQLTLQRKVKSLKDDGNESVMVQFRHTWEEVMQSPLSPSKVIGDCNMTWMKAGAIPWWEKPDRTCEKRSFIREWDVRPAGEFSTVTLQTMYTNNTLKTQGGDFWRVRVSGNQTVPVTKFDLGNGSYQFKFLTMMSGHYKLEIVLEYTLCDGVKEPPPFWFIQGNKHGKEQREGTLHKDSPFINKKLWHGAQVILYVPPNRLKHEEESTLSTEVCAIGRGNCKYLWNDYGTWFNTTWKPFCPEIKIRYPRNHQGILWVFGDSTSTQFYHRIKFNRLCKQIFKTCMYTYNWIYSLQNYNLNTNSYTVHNSSIEKTIWDGLDFNTTKLIDELKQAIFHPNMDENSVILFNYGLHFTEATNFTNFQKLIDAVIDLRKHIHCKMIWRTITSLNRHKYRRPNLHSRRFMTSQRVMLYNAYATREFCKAGFEVIDLYQITDAYPYGTGSKISPTDPVHYEFHVMKPMETMLERVFEPDPTT